MKETFNGLRQRYTFAGAGYFERMKERNLYSVDSDEIRERVERVNLSNIFKERLV
jgi:hypothetical protein